MSDDHDDHDPPGRHWLGDAVSVYVIWLLAAMVGLAALACLLLYRDLMGSELFDEAFIWRDVRSIRRCLGV